MFLRVSKYPSSAIFRNAIINAQRANVTGSMIWLTSPRPPILCRAGLRSPDACILLYSYLSCELLHGNYSIINVNNTFFLIVNCERSELSGLFNGTDFLYNYKYIYNLCIYNCERSELSSLFNARIFYYYYYYYYYYYHCYTYQIRYNINERKR